ncbi:MAG TPA: 1-acyl-sn-glycerol-3-phosphate acyltransferase [Firmicutes bacterium]|nr:1-acyl-sn-glycerol-3-phosphate acyltransferase [Bacillota bacterium]
MRLARFLLTFFKPLFWLLFPYKVIGRENVPPEGDPTPLMLCPNHISDIDPVFVLMAMKRHVYYMAKAELFRSKLAAWFVGKKFGAFPVKRGAGDTGAIDTAKQIVESGKVLGIFPEGTRSKDGKLGRAKSGAALVASQTGACIVPVAIKTKGQKVRLFRLTTLVFGNPLSPQELHLDDPEHPDLRYASRYLMERIAQMLEESH